MAPFTNISDCVSFFFGKMSRLTLYLKINLIIHVFGKVQGPIPQLGICTMSILKTFLNVPIPLKITKSTLVYVVNADFQVLL